MRFTSQTSSDGVTEQLFTLSFTFGEIPGVLWAPDGAAGSRPLILMGHGGGQHKKAPGIVTRARRFAAECGFAVAAVDAPAHGDRPRNEEHNRVIAEMRTRMQTVVESESSTLWVNHRIAVIAKDIPCPHTENPSGSPAASSMSISPAQPSVTTILACPLAPRASTAPGAPDQPGDHLRTKLGPGMSMNCVIDALILAPVLPTYRCAHEAERRHVYVCWSRRKPCAGESVH
jgi:hypothetical protein